MRKATLYILSGLPGSGKTTVARRLVKQLRAVHVRVDTIEQGLRDFCGWKVQGEGYRLVTARDYQPWQENRLRLDTTGENVDASVARLLEMLRDADGCVGQGGARKCPT
ncbi:MAG: AAA family ATPase [Thermodesulfobacteriota bacterium]